jgi:hypothetical protein
VRSTTNAARANTKKKTKRTKNISTEATSL